MIRNLHDSNQVAGYEKSGATVIKGIARITEPGTIDVDVGGRNVTAEHLVIATGSHGSGLVDRAPRCRTGVDQPGGHHAQRHPRPRGADRRSAVDVELGLFLRRYSGHVTILERSAPLHLGRDRKTIRAYLDGERVPGERKPAGDDPFESLVDYVRERLAEDPHLWAVTLLDEITGLGYDRSYPTFTARSARGESPRVPVRGRAGTRSIGARPARALCHHPDHRGHPDTRRVDRDARLHAAHSPARPRPAGNDDQQRQRQRQMRQSRSHLTRAHSFRWWRAPKWA
jgi:hypothetical protein